MNSVGKDESAQFSNEFQSYEMDYLDLSYYKMSVIFVGTSINSLVRILGFSILAR